MLIIVKNTLVEINIAWKKIKKRNKENEKYEDSHDRIFKDIDI